MTRHTTNDTLQKIAFGTFACIVLAFGIALLAVGTGAAAVITETTNTTEETEEIVVDTTWNDSAPADANVTVELVDYETYSQEGQVDPDDYDPALSGTEFTLTGDVYENGAYSVQLNSSATTVNVNGSDFENGTVDLANHTDATIDADDDVTNVDLEALPVLEQNADVEPGNVTTTIFDLTETEIEEGQYYVFVDGEITEDDVDDVLVDTIEGSGGIVANAGDRLSGLLGAIIGDNNPFYVAGAVILIGGAAFGAYRKGWLGVDPDA